jgi:hypothetical protein
MIGKVAAWGIGLIAGGSLVSKLFGTDPDFNQAYLINRMSGQGGFWKTYFNDGLKSLFLGSRTASAMFGAGGFGSMMYGNPYMMGMNPYMMNPMMMGRLPYGAGFGPMAWGMY